jgi:eukaryotic-like serine/threonine-protein kinase
MNRAGKQSETERLRERLAMAEQRNAELETALADAKMAQQQLESYADDFRRTYTESRRRLQQMTALYEVSTAIASTVDPGEVLERITEGLARLLPSDQTAIFLVDDSGEPVIHAGSTHLGSPTQSTAAALERDALERCLTDGRPVLEGLTPTGSATRGSIWTLALPLSVGKQRLGALLLARQGGSPFADNERRMAEMVAAQSAMALQNARLATTDGLTGLYNRRHFEQALAFECERARRTRRPLGLVMADVDHFKRFNDRFGHSAGDEVLRVVAMTFAGQLRRTDTVARVGGEEFVAILPEDSPKGVAIAAERVRQAVEQQPRLCLDGYQLPSLHVSVGGASMAPEVVAPRTLMKAADSALRQAKRQGRNRSVVVVTDAPEAS